MKKALFVTLTILLMSAVGENRSAFSIGPAASLSLFLSREFRFVEDKALFGTADYWQTPEEFLKSKQGDCEDFALLASQMLNEAQLPAQVVSLYGSDGLAHTVAVFRENDQYSMIDCGKLQSFSEKSIEALLSKAYPNWTWACIARAKNGRGQAISYFKRPAR